MQGPGVASRPAGRPGPVVLLQSHGAGMTHIKSYSTLRDRNTADRRARTWAAGRAGSCGPGGPGSACALAENGRCLGHPLEDHKTRTEAPASGVWSKTNQVSPSGPSQTFCTSPGPLLPACLTLGPRFPRDKAWEKASSAVPNHVRETFMLTDYLWASSGSRKIMFSPKT